MRIRKPLIILIMLTGLPLGTLRAYLPPLESVESEPLDTDSIPTVVTENDKKTAQEHFQKGKEYLRQEAFDEAIEEFTIALKHYPKWTKAVRGLSWTRKDKQRALLAASTGASSLNELVKLAQKYYQQGEQLEEQGLPIKAILKYKTALKIIPGYPEALTSLRNLQAEMKENILLETNSLPRTSSKAIHKKQQQEMVSTIKSASKRKNRSGEKATKLKEAIQKRYLKGIHALQTNDFVSAIDEFELVLEFVPDHTKALFQLNKAKKEWFKQFKQVKQMYIQAKESGDDLEELTRLRELIALNPEDSEVKQFWEKAKQDKNQVIEKLYRDGVDAYATGKYSQALQIWDLVLDLKPDHQKAISSMKTAREKLELINY